MKSKPIMKTAGAAASMGIVALGGMLILSPRAHADGAEDALKIQIGYQIAPVKLNLTGKDHDLVGLGSYIVNGANDCNACHNSGGPPNFDYLAGGNPYNGQHPTALDPSVYLGGGQDFGPVGPPPSPDIITRNLTPDKTGRPAGGLTLDQFTQVIRNGTDFDHLHPNCTATITTNCIPLSTGLDGSLLQIMPWPYFQAMTDHDLLAIYTYLSAIPCIEGPSDPQNPLHNDCPTTASAAPKAATVLAREIMLDGTGSMSGNGKPLTYSWSIPQGQGNPSAAILGATTATPRVQFGPTRGLYTFQLTVTDSTGTSASDIATVNYQGN